MNAYEQRVLWAVRPLWLWRMLRLVLRSFWLSAAVGAIGWLVSRALHWPISLLAWSAGSFALFMLLLPVVTLWPLSLGRVTRRLDQSFGLADRLTTAHEIARRSPAAPNYLEARLMQSSHRLLGDVRTRLGRQPRVPWLDFELSLLALMVLYGCYLLAGAAAPGAPPIPSAAYLPLPPLMAEETVPLPGVPPELNGGAPPFSPAGTGADQTGLDPAAAQQALDGLAQALNSQSVTQPAGSALAQGDAGQAADELRDLAGAADQLSDGTQQALAESLAGAAEQLQDSAPSAADQIAEAARALSGASDSSDQTGGSAASALEGLAQLVDQLDQARKAGANGDGQGAGAGKGAGGATNREEQTQGSTDRLDGESDIIDLPESDVPSDDPGALRPPEQTGDATEQRDLPYTQSGATGSGGDEAADPLSFPWKLRNVIQRYFSPR